MACLTLHCRPPCMLQLLQTERSQLQQFLYECTVEALVKDVLKDIVSIHNLRQKIAKLHIEGKELAQYGPSKHPEKQGIDTYAEENVEKGEFYKMDPTGRRTGNACKPEHAKVLLRTLDEAEDLASHKQVDRKVPLNSKMLSEKVEEVKGAIMICYPMGLPQWDVMRLIVEDSDEGTASFGTDDVELESGSLWFAGKEMLPENKLKVHIGRHEKTKAVVKLQKKGQGAPAREPVVDEATQKSMIAWYHKKQEEQKALDENQDDSYMHSSWASGNSLKANFSGVSEVRLPY